MAVLAFPLVVVAVMAVVAVVAVANVRQPTVPLVVVAVVAVAVWGQPTRHRAHMATILTGNPLLMRPPARTPTFQQMPWPSLSLVAIGNRM
jgi:hypothetical protein